MNNTHLWRALGRNTVISVILFGALLGLLWLVETYLLPCGEAGRGYLLKWHDPAWVVGIPASIIGVAYILTVRDPQNYTGFFAGIVIEKVVMQMEKYYIDAMDHEALNRVYNGICEEIDLRQ